MIIITIKKNTSVKTLLKLGENCSKYGNCCSHGSGLILPKEIKKLAKQFSMTEEEFKKKYLEKKEKFNTICYQFKLIRKKDLPFGRCVFYDAKKGCTIHEIKPIHCKITTCDENGQAINTWFHLNYLVNADDPESIRQWAQTLKTQPTIQGGKLEELVPDKEILKKILSYEILR